MSPGIVRSAAHDLLHSLITNLMRPPWNRIGIPRLLIEVDATSFLPCDIALKDKTMNSTSELAVTLSAELLEQLKAEAETLGLPVEWLVASLVADTIDAEEEWEPATD